MPPPPRSTALAPSGGRRMASSHCACSTRCSRVLPYHSPPAPAAAPPPAPRRRARRPSPSFPLLFEVLCPGAGAINQHLRLPHLHWVLPAPVPQKSGGGWEVAVLHRVVDERFHQDIRFAHLRQPRPPGMHWKGGRYPPPPPSRAPSLCPATVSLTPSASFDGICNRQ